MSNILAIRMAYERGNAIKLTYYISRKPATIQLFWAKIQSENEIMIILNIRFIVFYSFAENVSFAPFPITIFIYAYKLQDCLKKDF